MQSVLFKPLANQMDSAESRTVVPKIEGAQVVVQADGSVHAHMQGNDIEKTTSCFFEENKDFASRVTLKFEEGSRHLCFVRAEHFGLARLDLAIEVATQAESHIVLLIKTSRDAECAFAITSQIEADASLDISFLNLNAGTISGDISNTLCGHGAKAHATIFDMGRHSAATDLRVENICAVPHTSGNIVTRSILYDRTQSRIQGAPIISAGAHDAENHLDQMSILLSPNARSESVPLLSVANNAVRASHRSAIARMSEEDLFYCNTRGITRAEAEKLYLSGFLHQTVRGIPVEAIVNCTTEAVSHFVEDVS